MSIRLSPRKSRHSALDTDSISDLSSIPIAFAIAITFAHSNANTASISIAHAVAISVTLFIPVVDSFTSADATPDDIFSALSFADPSTNAFTFSSSLSKTYYTSNPSAYYFASTHSHAITFANGGAYAITHNKSLSEHGTHTIPDRRAHSDTCAITNALRTTISEANAHAVCSSYSKSISKAVTISE